jgi:cytochrome c biogenesis protein CcmG/thiol:disulfide interchange protein DsbE
MAAVRAAVVACVLALLGVLVWDFVHQQNTGVAGKVDRGETVSAPALKLPRLDHTGTFDLTAYRGKVVVVNFWASWCVDCKLEAKTFATAAQQWHGKDVVFLGVDSQDGSGPARSYMSKYHMDYPVVRDGEGTQGSQDWGVTGYPETFVVDPAGQIPGHEHWAEPIISATTLDTAIRQALRS